MSYCCERILMTDFIINPEKACCFTGHRDISAKEYMAVRDVVDEKIKTLISLGYTDFICGGALGFDTIAATSVIVLRRQYAKLGVEIKLHLFLPCRGQEKSWQEHNKRVYQVIMDNADSIKYLSEQYERGIMYKRNRAMVDSSSCVVAYCMRKKGGTAYTVDYALQNDKQVIFLPAIKKPVAKSDD